MENQLFDLEAEARNIILPSIKIGFDSDEYIIERTINYLIDNAPDEDETRIEMLVQRITHDALRDYEAEQVTWITPTDCDRLDLAFAQLEEVGIVARQNFTC